MKEILIKIALYIARSCMSIIYFFIKLLTRQKNKITMLSRQSDKINIDFSLLKEELESKQEKNFQKKIEQEHTDSSNKNFGQNIDNGNNNELKIKILCRKIPKGLVGKIKYCFYIIKCMHHIATSKICIIDGYNIAISALKHKKNLQIIQIWHAAGAIKKFGYQVLDKKDGRNSTVAKIMRMHANYTCVTCISEETRKIYAEAFNTDIEKVKVLGMPRLDYILGKNGQIDKNVEAICKEYPYIKDKKIILYVPTFRKNEKIDIQKIINAVDETKYNLIIRLHPLDEAKIDEKYIINRKYSTSDLIKLADYVITDYSAIAFETAALDKQLFFYVYDIEKYENDRGLNIDLIGEMQNLAQKNIEDIMKIIESNTYDYEELEKFKNKYVQTADTHNTERIAQYINRFA